jgi:mRNA interferase MazF
VVKAVADIQRGETCWADLAEPRRSEPGFRHPVLVIQANSFNRSRIETVIAAVITSNLQRALVPGNVLLRDRATGLPQDSVVNVPQLLTLNRDFLTERVGTLSTRLQTSVDTGLRLVLEL